MKAQKNYQKCLGLAATLYKKGKELIEMLIYQPLIFISLF